ncbi:M81 family metallopeptidase [Pseudooceanicola nanhaiensis]|uniref:M81 family metallopeptidase n=1 Tax=Pseudooceanicola nanhaiensis TaxID=375761 RepID=UPI001CD229F3|nr:M81 family metallopeptidase [Pseudooceanicola nanhaiensis]MCA0922841.1 M81 family metallopeptidase [Pseudooceanicola nanhaiensis]
MKIAAAGFQHETNSFAGRRTPRSEFDRPGGWPAFCRGEEMGRIMRGTGTPMAGALRVADAAGVEVVPILWCIGLPSGPVEDAAFDDIACDICRGFEAALTAGAEALYLDLHGAMAAVSWPDAEGELIRRLRKIAPAPFPIVASFDLHGNISEAMVRDLTLLDCYRTYPHTDLKDTGARTMERLIAHLDGAPAPVLAYRAVPFLVPAPEQCTFLEPTKGLLAAADALIAATPGIEEISQFFGFPLADVPDSGPAMIVQGQDPAAVEAAAEHMLNLWCRAESAFHTRRVPAAQAVAEAVALAAGPGTGPVVISDTQDNPGGGGSGDTTGMLHALLAGKAVGAVMVHIADEPASLAAHAAGLGGVVDLAIGAGLSREYGDPVPGPWTVVALGDGSFTGVGPMYRGNPIALGPVALLERDGVRVIVAPRKMQASEPGLLMHLGLVPEEQAILVLKSSVHFRGAYQDMARAIVMGVAPGCVVSDLTLLDYKLALRKPAGSTA